MLKTHDNIDNYKQNHPELIIRAVNRKPIRWQPIVSWLFVLVMAGMVLTASAHYVWYRWTVETTKVQIQAFDLIDATRRDELGRLYYEEELAQYRPISLDDTECLR